MTETTIYTRAGIAVRIRVWVRRRQRELSARIYAAGDVEAQGYGWTVTETTGRFGFSGRSYRDPRFNDRRRQLAPGTGALGTCSDAAPTSEAGE
jgi:hypothetical protein